MRPCLSQWQMGDVLAGRDKSASHSRGQGMKAIAPSKRLDTMAEVATYLVVPNGSCGILSPVNSLWNFDVE